MRSDPEYFRGFPVPHLERVLHILDIVTPDVPADSPRAAQLGAFREHVQAALAAQAAAPRDQVPAAPQEPAPLDPGTVDRSLDLLAEQVSDASSRGESSRLEVQLARLDLLVEWMPPSLSPVQAERLEALRTQVQEALLRQRFDPGTVDRSLDLLAEQVSDASSRGESSRLEGQLVALNLFAQGVPLSPVQAERLEALRTQVQEALSRQQNLSVSVQDDPAVGAIPPSKAQPPSEVQAGAGFGSGQGEGQQVAAAGTPGLMALTDKDKKLAAETPGRTATPAQEVSTGTLATVKTMLEAGAVGFGSISLLLLFQAFMTAACKGPCPIGTLGPAVPSPPVVPGHLQG
jgi:hypothetical protein